METPERWVDDIGVGELVGGRATVQLASEFAAQVGTDNYHVFLSPEGESRGLYVSRKSQKSFEVREQQAGTSSLPFSYRVMARRTDDLGASRLEQLNRLGAKARPQAVVSVAGPITRKPPPTTK
jgi:hypothetical protein